ncbi:DUF938 domain-containing protein [Lutimaribacter marinistellae]|uniref:DUF938 domain-containing protein n=1 Tax=Lutimaribacter marinistellae TaxID=1820329 RepID=A0ABV7TDL8_9RHOB
MSRKLPPQASVAEKTEGAKMSAPAAERNSGALSDLLSEVAPLSGRVLELASGTGQHVATWARRFPSLHWQPSEPDAERRASIDAWAEGVQNVAPAIDLDAARKGWAEEHAGQDLIVLVNLLHLISEAETAILIAEAARALNPGGRFLVYGPFMRAGELTSHGDARFDATLRAQDPEIGYKDDFDMIDLMQNAGLEMALVVEMPANNLALIAERPRF